MIPAAPIQSMSPIPAAKFATKKDVRGYQLALPDGSTAQIRCIKPTDREALIDFHRQLSARTVYLRYFSPISLERRTSPSYIAKELCNDPDHHLTLIVERTASGLAKRSIVGIGRLVINAHNHAAAELAMTIHDAFQGMGLGAALLDVLIDSARNEGLTEITAVVLYDNSKMLQLCREHGFRVVSHDPGGPLQLALDVGNACSGPAPQSPAQ